MAFARVFLFAAIILGLSSDLLAADRDVAGAHVKSAKSNFDKGDFQTAKSMCERALQEDNTFPDAHFLMGQTLEAQNQPREAIKSYQLAADFAKKENNNQLSSKALEAAKKLGPGLVELNAADQKLVDKLVVLADKAMADEQYDTARQAYNAALALAPAHEKARENLLKTEKAIEARGDPIKAKIAAAAMSEVWYYVGVGNKEKARQMATEVSSKFGDIAAGKDAAKLLANNFDLSKTINQEIAAAKQELIEQQKKIMAKPAVKDPVKTTPSPATVSTAPPRVDVDNTEKVANDEAKKLPKDKLVSTYTDFYTKGKDFYSKATPGSEGNQKNLASALDQFIRCESLYMRLEEEKMLNPEIEEMQKQASMLRYACMKMTILSH
jgi:tetratricopeptide (TPR) repeat protein